MRNTVSYVFPGQNDSVQRGLTYCMNLSEKLKQIGSYVSHFATNFLIISIKFRPSLTPVPYKTIMFPQIQAWHVNFDLIYLSNFDNLPTIFNKGIHKRVSSKIAPCYFC